MNVCSDNHLCVLCWFHTQLPEQCCEVEAQQFVGHLLALRLGAEGTSPEGDKWPGGVGNKGQSLASCRHAQRRGRGSGE